MKTGIVRTAIIISLLFTVSSWGFLVHRTIGQLAIYKLPSPMRPFFYKHENYIVQEIIQPDLRRNQDPQEAPKHFIDLERYGDSAAWKMPLHWDDAVRIYSKDSLFRNGYVPYEVVMMKERLTGAFRSGNSDSILLYAADLGHYISDANVPLHTTVNYDGQLSQQLGIHNLWESTVPETSIEQLDLYAGRHAHYLDDPAKAIWEAVRHAYSLLPEVFEKEKEISKNFPDSFRYRVEMRRGKEYKSYSPEFAKAYGAALGNMVNDQLRRSVDLTADFWYSSWVDAGKPDLGSLLPSAFTKKDKKALRQECRAYRKNQLIQKKLLLAVHS